jgi:hypothetical protein
MSVMSSRFCSGFELPVLARDVWFCFAINLPPRQK